MQLKDRNIKRSRLHTKVYAAISLLESRYDDPPSASELAKAAGMSLYHFHRNFRQVVGESVTQHSKRLRLERVASLLKFSSWQIGDIALACGFQTQSSLVYAFQQFYAMSPRAYRENNRVMPYLRGNFRHQTAINNENTQYHAPMTVRIESWPETKAICLRFYGNIYQLYKPWNELLDWARGSIPNLERARFFGLWFDDWSDITDQYYRYECVIVPEIIDFELLPPFAWRTFEAGEVAITEASGTISQLENIWRIYAYGWLPFSGYQPRDTFVFDRDPASLMLSPTLLKLAKGLIGLNISLCLPVQTSSLRL